MNPSRAKIPVIIDTDPGVDDIVAILLALASAELEILAFIVTFGNTEADGCQVNILKVCQALARTLQQCPSYGQRFSNFTSATKPIPVAIGSDAPLEGEIYSAKYFHGRDGLGDIAERHKDLDVATNSCTTFPLRVTKRSGIDIALELIREQPAGVVTYIALGPLSSLARIIRQDGELFMDRIGRVIAMGGALEVPGNTTPVAEFNFFADPFSVKELLLDDNKYARCLRDRFILLPLDITSLHEMPFEEYKRKVDPSFGSTAFPSMAAGKLPLTHFTSSFLERTREILRGYGKDSLQLHDIVAMWCAIDNPPGHSLTDGWKTSRRIFSIERKGEITRGMLVIDRRDKSIYPHGENRAQVVDKHCEHRHGKSIEDSEPVDSLNGRVNHDLLDGKKGCGVLCVTSTPGPEALLRLLFNRVWGVEG